MAYRRHSYVTSWICSWKIRSLLGAKPTDVDLRLQRYRDVDFPKARVHVVSTLKLFFFARVTFPRSVSTIRYTMRYVHHLPLQLVRPRSSRRGFVKNADAYGKSKQRRDGRWRYSYGYIVVRVRTRNSAGYADFLTGRAFSTVVVYSSCSCVTLID